MGNGEALRPGGEALWLTLSEADFNADHFVLFGLQPAFRIDAQTLDERFRKLQAQVHPDRFTQASESERRASLQWATRVNEAYQSLKTPLSRAQYLIELTGHCLDRESNTAMPPEFLIEQMEWREAVAEAMQAGQIDELDQLHHRVGQETKARYAKLAGMLDDQADVKAAADEVRCLMFLEKLLAEIDDGMAALEN